jgi:hypothetical protein
MATLPEIGTYGVFTTATPFNLGSVNYRVTAITLITTLIENNIDVYNSFYAPFNLSNDQFAADVTNGVAIVTFESDDGPTFNIPSTYVLDTPVNVAVPYNRLVVSLDLGLLPDTLVVGDLLVDLQTIANNYVGVTSVPRLHKIPVEINYSYPDYLINEANRKLTVQQHLSFYTEKVNADAELKLAKEKIVLLEAALITANKLLGR